MIIGLTGGIASGKSLVSKYLRESGIKVLDLDEIAREVVKPGLPAWEEIVNTFGKGILTPAGEIDRKRLGSLVFNDSELLKRLNSITHPKIIDEARKRIEEIKRKEKAPLIVVDAALLIESGYNKKMDKTIVVYVDEETQIERLRKRDGLSKEEARKRVRAQMPLRKKLLFADYVIYNEGSREETKKQLLTIISKLKSNQSFHKENLRKYLTKD